jgi:response regulator RpfG family c-di-GMP phosphodiesterase
MPEYRKKTVLAIDDDITVLTTVRTILESMYEVCLAKSAEIAWTILNSVEIDLILLDMEMPGVSGLDFLASLHQEPSCSFIPVIIVSSHGTTDYIINARKAGAKDFVVKPIQPKILKEKIEGVFQSVPAKTPRDMLIRSLSLLAGACKQGKGTRVEELIKELGNVRYNRSIDAAVADINVCAARLDYALAVKKIENLIPRI